MFGVERQVCQTKAMSQQFLKQRRCHDNFDIDILGCAVINDMQLVLSIVNTCPHQLSISSVKMASSISYFRKSYFVPSSNLQSSRGEIRYATLQANK